MVSVYNAKSWAKLSVCIVPSNITTTVQGVPNNLKMRKLRHSTMNKLLQKNKAKIGDSQGLTMNLANPAVLVTATHPLVVKIRLQIATHFQTH